MSKTKHIRHKTIILFCIFAMLTVGCTKNVDHEGDKEESLSVIEAKHLSLIDETTVIRGDFIRSFTKNAKLYQPHKTSVIYTGNHITTVFDQYLVGKGEVVHAQDKIAQVHYETDPVLLEELKIQVKRLNEDLEEETSIIVKNELKEMIKEKNQIIDEYKLEGTTDYIVAPCDGVITVADLIHDNAVIQDGDIITVIKDNTALYLSFEDDSGETPYGLSVSIHATIKEENKTLKGKIVSGVKLASKRLYSGQAMVQIEGLYDQDDMVRENYSLQDLLSASFTVYGEYTNQKNVLLVEIGAVTRKEGECYVNTNENGENHEVKFLSGGINTEYYWALDGLTEGMTILK